MKKLTVFLTALLAVSAAACAGCNFKGDSADMHEPEEQNQQQTREYARDNEGEQDGDNCRNRCPRVKLGHRNGYAVGYKGQFEGGEFFVIQFGSGECPELPELPAIPENENDR